jgi:nitroreductase
MSFLQLAGKRRCVRAYRADEVEEEKLQAVPAAARGLRCRRGLTGLFRRR